MTVGLPLGAVTLRPMALTGNVGQAEACPNLDLRVNLPLTVGSPPRFVLGVAWRGSSLRRDQRRDGQRSPRSHAAHY